MSRKTCVYLDKNGKRCGKPRVKGERLRLFFANNPRLERAVLLACGYDPDNHTLKGYEHVCSSHMPATRPLNARVAVPRVWQDSIPAISPCDAPPGLSRRERTRRLRNLFETVSQPRQPVPVTHLVGSEPHETGEEDLFKQLFALLAPAPVEKAPQDLVRKIVDELVDMRVELTLRVRDMVQASASAATSRGAPPLHGLGNTGHTVKSCADFFTCNDFKSDVKEQEYFEDLCGLSPSAFLIVYGGVRHHMQQLRLNPSKATPERREFPFKRRKIDSDVREEFFMVLVSLRHDIPSSLGRYMTGYSTTHYNNVRTCVGQLLLTAFVATQWYKLAPEMSSNDYRVSGSALTSGLEFGVLDCTEVFAERPSTNFQQKRSYSQYKHHTTTKYLVFVDMSGGVLYTSQGFEGSITDDDIVERSGFLEYLEAVCDRLGITPQNPAAILVDRGYRVSHLAAARPKLQGLSFIPSGTIVRQKKPALLPHEATFASATARVRCVVERTIRRVKTWRAARAPMRGVSKERQDREFQVCAYLSNFKESLLPVVSSETI